MHRNAYDRILGILCSVLDAYSAVLFLRDVSSDGVCDTESSCHLKATFSLGDKVKPSAVVEPGKGLVGWILRNGEPLLVPNFDQRRHQLGYYREGEEDRIKAFMGCALPGGYGVLCVDSKRQYSFSEKDQKLLHLFAELLVEIMGQIGLAEEQRLSLRYYAALKTVYTLRRRHSRWAEFLHQFLQLMAAAGGFSYALFCSLKMSRWRLRHVTLLRVFPSVAASSAGFFGTERRFSAASAAAFPIHHSLAKASPRRISRRSWCYR